MICYSIQNEQSKLSEIWLIRFMYWALFRIILTLNTYILELVIVKGRIEPMFPNSGLKGDVRLEADV